MAGTDPLTDILVALARLPAELVTPEARLGDLGMGSSIALGILRSRLGEAFGHAPDDLSWKTSVAELRSRLRAERGPVSSGAAPRTAPRLPVAGFVVGVGLDLEEVANLPELGDRFFADHFTAAELEAARSKDDARRHLCGVWCTKEAARKAVPSLIAVPLNALEVLNGPTGRPMLRILDATLESSMPRLEVSVTHTDRVAAAVVIALDTR